jgi:cell division protein FtsB
MFAAVGAVLSEKFSGLGLYVSKQRYTLIAVVGLASFLIVMIFAIALVVELKADVLDYEGKIAIMSSRMERWERAASDNEVLLAENNELITENDVLSAENNNLSAANSELERQNGDLSKKFDGLSKPN